MVFFEPKLKFSQFFDRTVKTDTENLGDLVRSLWLYLQLQLDKGEQPVHETSSQSISLSVFRSQYSDINLFAVIPFRKSYTTGNAI